MGQSDSRQSQATSPRAVEAPTGFSRQELNDLHKSFSVKYPNGYLTKQEFIEENMSAQGGSREFWSEIASHFTAQNDSDKIPFREFLTGLSSITSGTPEDKLDWMFRLYDADGNGVLDRQEIFLLVKGVLKAQNDEKHRWTDQELKAKADMLFDQMDKDKNGTVDKPEFVAVASRDEQIVSSLASNISSVARVEQSAQEFTTFDQQVAGHSKGDMAMLSTGNTIMKPMSEAEFEFYVHAQKNISQEQYKLVFPGFFGRKAVTAADGSVSHYLVLEDLTSSLKKANIMDLKIGFRGHDDQARGMKGSLQIVQQVALCSITTSSSLGFRLCGMRYHDDLGAVVVHGKPWGAQLRKDTMPAALIEFVTQHGHIRFDVVEKFVQGMIEIRRFFSKQTLYKFYSSSVLFVWDAASSDANTVHVKLVDFAHTYPNKPGDNTLDLNSLEAVESLLEQWMAVRGLGEEIWENQRSIKGVFASKNLASNERSNYSSREGKPLSFSNPNDWVVDKSETDDGWVYAPNWKGPWSFSDVKANVRRRRWIKKASRNSTSRTE